LLLAASDTALRGIWFVDQAGIPPWATRAPQVHGHPILDETLAQLQGYFSGERRNFDLPLDLSCGTEFQQAVWRQLQHIPYGESCSYSDVAQAVGRPRAVRAVGGAVGRNPLGIVLPCHRVLGQQGQLTGYTGGLARKAALLWLETS
jgi:methylated-DNA-[protein]-cysteine S-methyltransferase